MNLWQTKNGVEYMSPRTGRPPSENSMQERITVRLDKERSELLQKYCTQKNLDKAEAIRRGIDKLKEDINE